MLPPVLRAVFCSRLGFLRLGFIGAFNLHAITFEFEEIILVQQVEYVLVHVVDGIVSVLSELVYQNEATLHCVFESFA